MFAEKQSTIQILREIGYNMGAVKSGGIHMSGKKLTQEQVTAYRQYLHREEKSTATVEKYLRDVHAFCDFIGKNPVTKEIVVAYKAHLQAENYAARSINSMLAALNSLLEFLNWTDCKVKNLRTQRQTYCTEEKELTKSEYLRLLEVSKDQPQLNLVIQTICGTGIRVSELKYFTVEALKKGEITVQCKSKTRTILIPGKLKTLLLNFAGKRKITAGPVFVTRGGNPLDRSNIWARMKKLCVAANVNPRKVFPHNLRKLFARTFYNVEKDIAKLADILGHGSINTTRIYIMSTGAEHRRKIERLGLVQ